MTDRATDRCPSRRVFLGTVATGTVVLAGCANNSSEPDPQSDQEKLDEPPEGPPTLGDRNGEITLEVFEDFNCPHCQSYHTEAFPDVRSEYLDPERIRYVHRDLPFIHDSSWQAASAVREVYALYGTEPFWSYASALMQNGGRIRQEAPGIFGELADADGLDADTIQQAASSRTHDDTVQEDRSRADQLGVQGTPAFVVDGELMDGLADAQETIDAKLTE